MSPAPLFSPRHVSDHLPGEPRRDGASGLSLVVRVLVRLPLIAGLFVLTSWLWPLYGLGAAVYGWPPNVLRWAQVRRYLRLTWTVRPPAPGLSAAKRAWITLAILRKCAVAPVWGLAWLIDEALYGRALDHTPVIAPLLEISAGRSGSTQLARYLEADPQLVSPNFLQITFPYLWLWKLVPRTLGRVVSADAVRHQFESMLPPEFLQRHEGDPFHTDTFESTLYLAHLNHLSPFLGPDVAAEDFGFATITPHNRELWEGAFVDELDRIARKTLLLAGPGDGGHPRRFFAKGHFLCAGPALHARYPDARFLTMIREPAARLQSAVNYLRANPFDETLGAVPWPWLAEAITRAEVDYCEVEQRWFSQAGGARRCVLRFGEYVSDLEGAMTRVYRECLDMDTLPAHVPRQHPPRDRTNYLLNRSLAQVGIDEAALNDRLSGYITWCRGTARVHDPHARGAAR